MTSFFGDFGAYSCPSKTIKALDNPLYPLILTPVTLLQPQLPITCMLPPISKSLQERTSLVPVNSMSCSGLVRVCGATLRIQSPLHGWQDVPGALCWLIIHHYSCTHAPYSFGYQEDWASLLAPCSISQAARQPGSQAGRQAGRPARRPAGRPAPSSYQPAASGQQPAASSQQPAASSQQPAASSQQPAASSQQPAASSQQPAASHRTFAHSHTRTFPQIHKPTDKQANNHTNIRLEFGTHFQDVAKTSQRGGRGCGGPV